MSHSTLSALQGDITKRPVGAIVNAAKNSLLGGGGVDGAIHRAAGPQLLDACRALGGCATGAAKITPGYQLPAAYVIHTVGPVWHGGHQGEAELLASCYRSCLAIAAEHKLTSIAFPAISTGVYGYPPIAAARTALSTVNAVLAQDQLADLTVIEFVCFDADTLEIYKELLAPT